jgi:predicted hotdog family 3-hydroxylacyl-ACP dehydratase
VSELDRAWIASHLPHQGRMSLLDEIVRWDFARLVARSTSHQAPDNPLRRDGTLPAACGIEYGAQAVAAHGALLGGAAARGVLASVRGVTFHVARLDDIAAPLDIAVERLGGGAAGLLYRFALRAGDRELMEGRLTIALHPK